MNLLAFDTSTDLMSVAVSRTLGNADQPPQLWQHTAPGGAQTSANLIPVIQNLMAQASLQFAELDAIVFGCGPMILRVISGLKTEITA